MPSHQAPALMLKRWRPHWFCGLGLVLGSLAPDLEFILRLDTEWVVSHTLVGQLLFTVPISLALYWAITEWVVPALDPALPPAWVQLTRELRPRGETDWPRVARSALVGGLTHIFLDGFTHGGPSGWAVALWPWLRTPSPVGAVPVHDVLQLGLSLAFGAFVVLRWRFLVAATGQASAPAAADTQLRLGAWLVGCAVLGTRLPAWLRPGAPRGSALELAAYGAIDALLVGVVLAALGFRLWRGRGSARVPEGAPCG